MASPFTPATIPASSFNGGTITQSLTIDAPDTGGTVTVELASAPGTSVQCGVVDNGATNGATITVAGAGGGGDAFIQVENGSVTGTACTLNGEGTLSLFTTAGRKGIDAWDDAGNVLRFALLPAGQIMTGVVAAPADGDLAASQVALWFDDTNGVGNTKLMVKGKSADGTVKTATILLA